MFIKSYILISKILLQLTTPCSVTCVNCAAWKQGVRASVNYVVLGNPPLLNGSSFIDMVAPGEMSAVT